VQSSFAEGHNVMLFKMINYKRIVSIYKQIVVFVFQYVDVLFKSFFLFDQGRHRGFTQSDRSQGKMPQIKHLLELIITIGLGFVSLEHHCDRPCVLVIIILHFI